MRRYAPLQKKVATATAAPARSEAPAREVGPAPTPDDSSHLARSAELGHRFADIPVSRSRGLAEQGGVGPDGALVHEAAKLGTSGPGGPLPHLARIQRSFGRYDVSGIASHTGRAATAGARAMGAAAFTRGGHVAFAGTPSLYTAAHEAAHAVQQRAGVDVPEGVGQVGDPYERHADAVASAVTQGRSSEALLDRVPGGGRAPTGARPSVQGRAAVQRQFVGVDWGDIVEHTRGLQGANADAIRQKIHDLHGLDQEFPVKSIENMVRDVGNGMYDAHLPNNNNNVVPDEANNDSALVPEEHESQQPSNLVPSSQGQSAKASINTTRYGKLIKSEHNLDNNVINLDVDDKGSGQGLHPLDIYNAARSSHQLLTEHESKTNKPGQVYLRPGGSAVVKMVTEMLSESLGDPEKVALAKKLKAKRKQEEEKAKPPFYKKWFTKGDTDVAKERDKFDASVIPEHFAQLESLRSDEDGQQGSVSIVPLLSPMTQNYKTNEQDYRHSMTDTTSQGNAQYARYKSTLVDEHEPMSPALEVTLNTQQLGQIVAHMESKLPKVMQPRNKVPKKQ